jgi:hypothetical protein
MSSRSFGVAAVLAVVLALPAPAGAKGDVVARVLTPIPRDAAPGTTVSVAWTLTVVEAGKRRPFRAGYVFVRLVGLNGARTRSPTASKPGRAAATGRAYGFRAEA